MPTCGGASARRISQSLVLESPIATHRRLRLEFQWRGDRFGHAVELVGVGGSVPLLTSVEGAATDGTLPSPPLQQLHLEDRTAGRRVALLVGMAGDEHWSLSVEAEPDGLSLVFDVAVRRGRGIFSVPGSEYRIIAPDPGAPAETGSSRYAPRPPVWRLSALPAGGGKAADVVDQGGILRIVPPASSEATVRWKYRIELPA
jgi:hypothetical protein